MDNDLSTWLNYISGLHTKHIDLGLDRIKSIAERLNLLPFNKLVISVSGTNGKGSCVIGLETILLSQGYRVGSYLSPHLIRYNERVRINGAEVSDQSLCEAFSIIEKARQQESLTYFEFGTLVTLYLFSKLPLDIVILEVGLGGRLDAVNVVDADIAVVSSIALDHCQWLGDTREQIAIEKAGIFRTGKPAVCGDSNPPENFLQYAEQLKIPLYCVNRDFFYETEKQSWSWHNNTKLYANLPLPSIHLSNAASILQVLFLLQERLPTSLSVIKEGLKNIFIPGRQQKLFFKQIPIILDVAHNPHAATLLANTLSRDKISGLTHVIFSMLEDKDILGTIKALQQSVDFWYITSLNCQRGQNAAAIQEKFKVLNLVNYKIYLSPLDAFNKVITQLNAQDRLIVFGSFNLVGPIYQLVC